MRLLLVEDDLELARALADALDRRGFSSDLAHGFDDARQMLECTQYAALILDLGLPDGDGIALIQLLRGRKDPLPIIVATARDSIGERISGLDAGADDYVVKPFDVDELAARLGAVLRRRGSFIGTRLEFANIVLDTQSGDLFVGGTHVLLSSRERQLMELLLRRAGYVVSKQLAEDQLFGMSEPVGSNAVEVYVHRLRRKLQAASAAARIEAIRGVGYLIRRAQ